MSYLTSGNPAVDQVGRMSIVGNVVPASWFKTILTDSGKPYYLAIMILSDIVYWYRPTEIRDERTGQLLGWKKKFHNDMLQRNYAEYAKLMGESERTIIRAVAQLEQLGVVIRHRKDLTLQGGMVVRNVLFLELKPERLYELTFTDRVITTTENIEVDSMVNTADQNCQGSLTEFVNTPDRFVRTADQNCQGNLTEFVSIPDRFGKMPDQNCQQSLTNFAVIPDRIGNPNTNIKTNNTTESNTSINPSIIGIKQTQQCKDEIDVMEEATAYIEIIKENLNYDFHKKHDDFYTWEMFEELFEIICDVVCVKRKTVRINEEDYPYELVKSKYLKLNEEHISYVIECMRKTNTPVRNIRSYMITTLYNAPNTINNYYGRAVQQDLYG